MKSAGEAGVDMITDLLNLIIVRVIPEEWELSTSVKWCFKKRSWNHEMKSIDQILKIVESYQDVDKRTGRHWWDVI